MCLHCVVGLTTIYFFSEYLMHFLTFNVLFEYRG